jgi:nitroreductase
MEKQSTRILSEIIKSRRTKKPAQFSKTPPPIELITELIDIARHAPNHHRTEPARFYLLNQEKIRQLGKLFGETLAGNGEDPVLVEKGNRKTIEWGEAPGILLVTCKTDKSSGLVRKNPAVIEEDYATCSCICQNLLLLLEAEKIASKWSTGAVWEHPDFAKNIGIQDPENERVVGMIFYGYSEQSVPERSLSPLEQHLKTY